MLETEPVVKKRKRWPYIVAGATGSAVLALFIAGYVMSRRLEPFIKEQAILYLSERFECDVQLAALRIKLPKMSPVKTMLTHGRGVMARVEGEGISMRYKDADLPRLFAIRKFTFDVDLGGLLDDVKVINWVHLDGMEINIPPKGERRPITGSSTPKSESGSGSPKVLIQKVEIRNAKLNILPKDRSKVPLDFDLQQVILTADGDGRAMKYDASLTNPKPPGQIHAVGTFGPWVASDPSDTPLTGDYRFSAMPTSACLRASRGF